MLAASSLALFAVACGCDPDEIGAGDPVPLPGCALLDANTPGSCVCFDDGTCNDATLTTATEVAGLDGETRRGEPLESFEQAPTLSAAGGDKENARLDFGYVNAGQRRIVVVSLGNATGLRAALEVDTENSGIESEDAEGTFEVLQWPTEPIRAGESADMVIAFRPPSGGADTETPFGGVLKVTPRERGEALIVDLIGRGVAPKASFLTIAASADPSAEGTFEPIVDATFNIGNVGVQSPRPATMKVRNEGLGIFKIYEYEIQGDDAAVFSLISSPSVTLGGTVSELGNNQADISVQCNPTEQRLFEADLVLRHNDLDGTNADPDGAELTVIERDPQRYIETRVKLTCTGTPSGCPVPKATILQVSKARRGPDDALSCESDADCPANSLCTELAGCEPGEDCGPRKYCDNGAPPVYRVSVPVVVSLSGLTSVDPEGVPPEQLAYRWSFEPPTATSPGGVPLGSTAGFDGEKGNNVSTLPTPTFEIDIVGDYFLALQVTDPAGLACEPLQFRIAAKPAQKIRVELFWSAPKVDLDLHMTTTAAEEPATALPWSIPCDVYGFNKSPDWGKERGEPGPLYCRNLLAVIDSETLLPKSPERQNEDFVTWREECADDPFLDIDATHQLRECLPSERTKLQQYVDRYQGLLQICDDSLTRDCQGFLDQLLRQARKGAGLEENDDSQDETLVSERDQNTILNLCNIDTGPETLSLPEPREGTYPVYVHYFGGIFPASPRVRVFLNGEKVRSSYDTQQGEFLPPESPSSPGFPAPLALGDLWYVGDIRWPGVDEEGQLPDDFDPQAAFDERRTVEANRVPQTGLTCTLQRPE